MPSVVKNEPSASNNLYQFQQFLIVLIGFCCMGAGCGFERSLLPRMAVQTFHEMKSSTRLNFVASFGLSKAIANAVAGPLADKFGRKPTLILGCLVGLPVFPYVIIAQKWIGITLINLAFGLSQGLIGSSLFFLIIDLLGPTRRGVAVGVGECSIYVSTAIINIIAGGLAQAYGLRPVPFYVATIISAVGLLSTIPLQDTLAQALAEQSAPDELTKSRRKYARMGSTQPSCLDDEDVLIQRSTRGISYHSVPGFVSPWRGPSLHQGTTYPTGGGSLDDDSWIGNGEGGRWESMRSEEEADEGSRLLPATSDEEAGGAQGYQGTSTGFVIAFSAPSVIDDESVVELLLDPINPPDNVYLTLKHLVLDNPRFATLCFGGMVLNFKDGFAWGSFPVYFKHIHQLNDSQTDFLIALYPLCWGFSQAFTGALSDKLGRRLFLVAGTGSCAMAMALFTIPGYLWGAEGDQRHYRVWIFADVLLGLGTALVYPSLQAGAADEAEPKNRGIALGFYRFIRDMGYVVGAIVCGRLSDWIGYEKTFLVNAAVLGFALLCIVLCYRPLQPLAHARVPSNASLTSQRVRRVIRKLEHRCSDTW